MTPLTGSIQSECEPPSRLRTQPCCRRCRSRAFHRTITVSQSASAVTTKAVFTAVFEDESNSRGETSARLFLGSALAIGTRNLWAGRHEPLTIALEYRRELVVHERLNAYITVVVALLSNPIRLAAVGGQ